MFHSVNKFRTPVTILLSLIAVSFMGYGFVSLQGISRDNYIVKVGDQIITRYALDQAVQNTEAAGEPASREAVFQTLLQRAYLLEGAKQLGIVVSDEQIKQIVVDNPQFHDTSGKFDPKLFQTYLTNTRQSEESFMQAQRENLSVAALLQTLNSNAVSDFQAQQVINAVLAPRSTRAYVLNPQAFADKVKTDDAALKKYYEANKKDYLLPQGAKFEYIVLSPKDIAGKQSVSDAEIEAAYNASKGSLKPKRRVSHILIEAPKSADAATREKAKAEAEKIAAEAKAHPE
ncbi:MAG: SurA N-terminal domain-containing protein, partial [Kingella oralis]